MDFYKIKEAYVKKGQIDIFPDFKVCHSKDLMVRGKAFYAIWDEASGLWSTDEYEVARIVDKELDEYVEDMMKRRSVDEKLNVKYMSNFSSNSWKDFKKYVQNISDNSHQLDTKVAFSNTEVKKTDYISRRLPYPLEDGPRDSYEEIISTLYEPEERAKIEWIIGAIISGDAKNIQKFLVFYGDPGTGKSTILDIIQQLFVGYYSVFDAKSVTSSSNIFATETFKNNPLVAIQHDGDLSRIEDNTKLNSIVSHEEIIVNEKYKSGYPMRVNCVLLMGTNKPVKITDAKAGLIRRLIDVRPSGKKIPFDRYNQLKNQVQFELSGIAWHCLQVYQEMGKSYYSNYRPVDMMYKTDPFFNFVEDRYFDFTKNDGITLKAAYAIYKEYCDESNADYKLQMYKFREELKNYFSNFDEMIRIDDKLVRSYYSGFLTNKFIKDTKETKDTKKYDSWIVFKKQHSKLDDECMDCFAQYANAKETPSKKWDEVTTTLKKLDTSLLHYVKVPENHIVIDFDIKGEDGNKSFEKNLKAASKFPKTYAELSKSGSGIHLHYYYNGDVNLLSRVYDENIEVKVYTGNSSLRRKLTECNDLDISTISSGLPLKELKGDKMVNFDSLKNEKALRTLIKKNLNKEIHAGTKPSIDFIYKILEDVYNSGMHYDVTDMYPQIIAFAANSTHQSDYCIKLVSKMKFKSDEPSANEDGDNLMVFYDVEVFPNLFLVNWKAAGEDKKVVRMINPTPIEIEDLVKHKLVGFNCRRYDNHIMYARMMGYTNEELYSLSQKIIEGSKNAFFSEAYNLSYTDVYDFASANHKQSLKKFEIELGIHHQELGLPWNEPVDPSLWEKVAEYCDNDVIATEATFNYLKADWMARQILADVAGMSVNDTTNSLTTRIIFGTNRHPQDEFNYRNLAESFPGYKFEMGKSTYRGEVTGEGGYVYAEPGMYTNVALLDIASMHPSSIIAENLFGDVYTKRFKDIMDARLAAKHHDTEKLKTVLDGKLAKYLKSEEDMDALAAALKTAINSVYGLTSAKFDNLFRDPRNIDNIVAKRGALFMLDLKYKVREKGFKVAHIKTDSIKIPDATPEIIQFVMDEGKKFGYNFEHEATYEKMCLVNDAVYIAKYKDGKHAGEWTATGTQFQVPYVFKTLFSKEPILFEDMCETKSVSSSLYLDMNENGESNLHFVGKVGQFCPIKPGCGGGELLREKTEGGYAAATGSKGYRWLESEYVKINDKVKDIDRSYYNKLVDEAVANISQYGDFEWFVSDDIEPDNDIPFNGGKIVKR